jgi:hypothetical protein
MKGGNMLKSTPILLLITVLLIGSQACTVPGISTSDSNSMNTAIAQTIVSGLTQSAMTQLDINSVPQSLYAQAPGKVVRA